MKLRFWILGCLTSLWVLLLGSTLTARAANSSVEALDFGISNERPEAVDAEEVTAASPANLALPMAETKAPSTSSANAAGSADESIGLTFDVGTAASRRTSPSANQSTAESPTASPSDLALEEYRSSDRSATTVTQLRRAIIGQESGGKFDRVNPHSGALGYAQLMPTNVKAWGKEALGYAPSKREFLGNPQLQLQVIDHKLNQYWRQELRKAGGDVDTAVMRVASRWYSGNPELYTSSRPQFYRAPNGRSYRYPSISAYSWSVLRRFKALGKAAG